MAGGKQAKELPRHVAIIMDGNGRWARRRGRPRTYGHRQGVKAARAVVERAARLGVGELTLFTFSSENWQRPRDEVATLMRLFAETIDREVDALDKNGIALRLIGARESLPPALQDQLAQAESRTSSNDALRLNLAVAYGGRWDIANAARAIAGDVRDGVLDIDCVDEQAVADRLSLAGSSDPDLLIRTGGEYRISNFLLWNLAYSELYFTDTLWPDFDDAGLESALEFYSARQRRFGRTGDQLEALEG